MFNEHMEICSLVGTFSKDGKSHLHTVLGRKDGTTLAGHVMHQFEVWTTAEIVLGVAPSLTFTRELDCTTSYNELLIEKQDETPNR